MKKCSYCGKEYPDDAQQCSIDAQPLTGDDQPPAAPALAVNPDTAPPPVSSTTPETVAAIPILRLTDRQLRIFEVVLLCLICFGGSILNAAYHLLNSGSSVVASRNWLYATLHEATSLALLWNVALSSETKDFHCTGEPHRRCNNSWRRRLQPRRAQQWHP